MQMILPLVSSSSILAEIETELNKDHKKLKEWATKWLISFSPAKTEVVLVSNIFHDYDLHLIYDDTALNSVEIHKHLGIYLSANNKWTKHFDFIIDSASKQKKVREKSRECHNHKPQPFPDPKRKRKQTNPNKHKSNKPTKSNKISSLFPKRGNRNTKRTEKHKNKMTPERHTTNRLVE